MKLNVLLLLPAFLSISGRAYTQSEADTTLLLQDIPVLGKGFGGISGGETKRLEVEHNLSAVNGSVADAFRQLPSLVTDIEGGVVFRGSGKTGMLLNNVPYGLLEEYNGDALIQLPALFFQPVTVSSFPPVMVMPDGDAGLVNLSPAVYTASDSPLQVMMGAGLEKRYHAGAVVNLHPGKFHLVGKYAYRKEYRKREFQKTTENSAGSTELDNAASARPDIHLADLSVGYDLSPKDALTFYGLYYRMAYDRYGGINNTRRNGAGEILNKMLRHRNNRQEQEAYAIESRWVRRFQDPQEKLEALLNFNDFTYDEDNHFQNERAGAGIVAEDRLFVDHGKKNYNGTVSYRKRVLEEWFLTGGYTGRFRDEAYQSEASDKRGEEWPRNEQKSTDYTFNRFTNILFASVERSFGQFRMEAGAQAEHSRQNVKGTKEAQTHLYPRLKLSYALRPSSEIRLSYLQRVIRPNGIDLNPFVDYSDATHVIQGNPALENEFIHSIELAGQFGAPLFRLSPALYYRNRTNRIMEMAAEQDGQTVWRKENIGNNQTVGFELSANWNPLKPLAVGFSGDAYWDEIDGRMVGYGTRKSRLCLDVKGNVNLSLTPTTALQVDGFYISSQLTPQGEIKSRYTVNAGVSQYLFARRLRANLSINNLFDSLKEVTLIDTEAMRMRQVRNRDPRVLLLYLTFVY
ncbi:MAG: outer membrane beta-barrel family protein [Tannerellaceae bacterium]|jgi:outer membrane receptor for ferrienterochelin and colicin|nr:outer membrane beta-barrel family protein [Tannerellaceae bacterium]